MDCAGGANRQMCRIPAIHVMKGDELATNVLQMIMARRP